MAHLKELVAISDEIKAGGGVVVAATAEAPEHLNAVRASTGFAGPVIVDPEHLLAKNLKSKRLLDVAISDSQVYRLRGYKHGLAQPAVLVIRQDGTVMYRWAIVPSLVSECRNLGARGGDVNNQPVCLADEYRRRYGPARSSRRVDKHSEAAARGG